MLTDGKDEPYKSKINNKCCRTGLSSCNMSCIMMLALAPAIEPMLQNTNIKPLDTCLMSKQVTSFAVGRNCKGDCL